MMSTAEPITALEGPIKPPPDWKIERVLTPLSQTIDWSHGFFGLQPDFYNIDCSTVNVAVLDTGCDPDHPDLSVVDHLDFTGSGPGDAQSHGTWCIGFIGAVSNTVGIQGIANKVRMHNHKVLGNDGSGFNRNIHGGIRAAIDKKVDIISASWGGGGPDEVMLALFLEFIAQGGYVFAAAGNSSSQGQIVDEDYPAKWPEIPGVAAVGKNGMLTPFSSYGPGVVCCAPGYQMLSTIPGGYGLMSGTSMACPCVAGIAAVILAEILNRGLPRPSQAKMVELIQRTARVVNNLRVINPEGLRKEIAKTPLPPTENPPPTGKIVLGPLPIPVIAYAVTVIFDPLSGAKADPAVQEAAVASIKKMLEQASTP